MREVIDRTSSQRAGGGTPRGEPPAAGVLTEAFHILSPENLGARRLREFVLAGGTAVCTLAEHDLGRAFELMETYSNQPMDPADASLAVAAERLPTRRSFALDHCNFSSYRIRQGRRRMSFESAVASAAARPILENSKLDFEISSFALPNRDDQQAGPGF